jgi:hypothetical protein
MDVGLVSVTVMDEQRTRTLYTLHSVIDTHKVSMDLPNGVLTHL